MVRASLASNEKTAWLRLYRSENVGAVTFWNLLQRFGSATAALEALPALAKRGGAKRAPKVTTKAEAEAERRAGDAAGATLVCGGEPNFPIALMATDGCPPLLWARGNLSRLDRPGVSMVGARNASANGVRWARRAAHDLGRADVTVVSGLARGIDGAAHQGALDTEGGTVAVLAGGIDQIYPSEHRDLYAAICERGCVVSEMPPGTVAQGRHFPRRNRIVSALGLATVVVEAAVKSGSLITARVAGEQGRPVLAVPGSPLDPRAAGPNSLIRDGATLVRDAKDILEVVQPLIDTTLREPDMTRGVPLFDAGAPAPETSESELAEARTAILEKLGPTAVEVDELMRQCHLVAPVALTVLLELELAGRVERQPGGRVALRVDETVDL